MARVWFRYVGFDALFCDERTGDRLSGSAFVCAFCEMPFCERDGSILRHMTTMREIRELCERGRCYTLSAPVAFGTFLSYPMIARPPGGVARRAAMTRCATRSSKSFPVEMACHIGIGSLNNYTQ